jgi:hypothetical protein
MTEVEWSAPAGAKAGRSSTKRADFVRALKERPGEWAVYGRGLSASNVQTFRMGYPGVEAVSRKVDGERVIYVRWVGKR